MPRLLFLVLIAVATVVDAAPRRRAAIPIDPSPLGWLFQNSYPLTSTSWPAPASELEPLRHIVGDAAIVALGDTTHGTHEFFTIKIRLVEYLVRELGFDVLAFEAPLPIFDRLNRYVQTGEGDPRAILIEVDTRLGYRFWRVEEMLEVVEWLRAYNVTHGAGSVSITGADMFDGPAAVLIVLDYLRAFDPALAATAETELSCALTPRQPGCEQRVLQVRDSMLAVRDELVAKSGDRAFEEALQHVRIVAQDQSSAFERDLTMARNTRWIFENRSRSGKIMLWMHQEHVGKTDTRWLPDPATGWHLHRELGDRYVVIGTLTGSGSVLHWQNDGTPTVGSVAEPVAGSYESYFRQRSAPALLIDLTRSQPAWLRGPASYFAAGVGPFRLESRDSLPEKLDAVIYIEETTPTRWLE
jgi:erythromycin esterase